MSKQDYLDDIAGWNWDGFKTDQVQSAVDTISDNSVEELSLFEMVDDDGAIRGSAFVGTCFGLGFGYPLPEDYCEALDESADKHNMWSESGEGDPCDIFLCRWVSREEIVRYLLDGYRDVVNAWLNRKGGSIKDIKAIDPETKSILNKLDKLVE